MRERAEYESEKGIIRETRADDITISFMKIMADIYNEDERILEERRERYSYESKFGLNYYVPKKKSGLIEALRKMGITHFSDGRELEEVGFSDIENYFITLKNKEICEAQGCLTWEDYKKRGWK